jgi:hypothetical protein
VHRDAIAGTDWDGDVDEVLGGWRVLASGGDAGVDPDSAALITEAEVAAVRAAEEALRRPGRNTRP